MKLVKRLALFLLAGVLLVTGVVVIVMSLKIQGLILIAAQDNKILKAFCLLIILLFEWATGASMSITGILVAKYELDDY